MVASQDSDTPYARRDKNLLPGDALRRFAQAITDNASAIEKFSDTFEALPSLRLTSKAPTKILDSAMRTRRNHAPEEMKTATKNRKSRANGGSLTREDLLAAHRRALKRTEKLTAREGFETLVTAGIVTPAGKLSPRYGG